MTPEEALQKLADDLFPDVADQVADAIVNPPRTTETVGFYLRGDESDFELAFRKTVTLSETCDHVWAFEDKYVHEMIATWQRNNVLPKKLDPVITRVLDPFAKNSVFEEMEGSAPNANIFSEIRRLYPDATAALEQAFADQGKALLSFDLSAGDTIYFVACDPDDAETWRDRQFHDEPLLALRLPIG